MGRELVKKGENTLKANTERKKNNNNKIWKGQNPENQKYETNMPTHVHEEDSQIE